jgi:hypothetical protein
MTNYLEQGMESSESIARKDKQTIKKKGLKERPGEYWYTDPNRRKWGFTTRERMEYFIENEVWRQAGEANLQPVTKEGRRT